MKKGFCHCLLYYSDNRPRHRPRQMLNSDQQEMIPQIRDEERAEKSIEKTPNKRFHGK